MVNNNSATGCDSSLGHVSAIRLIVLFSTVFALACIPAQRLTAANILFPLSALKLANGNLQECSVNIDGFCSEYWFPSGPAMDTMAMTIFTDSSSEFVNIQSGSPSIDLTDQPLTPDLIGPFP